MNLKTLCWPLSFDWTEHIDGNDIVQNKIQSKIKRLIFLDDSVYFGMHIEVQAIMNHRI